MNMKKILLGFFLVFWFSNFLFAQGFKEHTIVAGETLSSIVEKYQVSPYELYQLNPDIEDGLFLGQVLVMLNNNQYPYDASLVDLKKYKVKKKETLAGIALANGVEESDIKKYNVRLYSDQVEKGDKIKIPVFNKNLNTNIIKVSTKDLETPEINEVLNTVTHKVLAKEGKYGISKKYGISIEELEAQNPEIVNGLKIGQILTISKNNVKISDTIVDFNKDAEFSIYTVQPKEGFYRLTKKLGISKDSLIVLNPFLSDGIKLGMELKYPINKLLKSDIPSYNLMDSISNYNENHITLMLPLMLNKIIENDTIDNTREALLNNPYTKRSLDFYSGVLMAADSMRVLGLSTKIRVFDTRYSRKDKEANAERIAELTAMSFKENEVVIGPLVPANVVPVASKLANKNISVIAPFPININKNTENIFKSNASVSIQRAEMIRFMESYNIGKSVIIIADKKMSGVKDELLLSFPSAKVIVPKEGNLLTPKDFNGVLSDDQENIVIVETKDVGLISTVSTVLDTKLKKHKIVLFTTSSYKVFSSLENRYKSKLNLHFPSINRQVFLDDENSFIKKYKSMYASFPSTYAIRGFDLTMDVLLRQAVAITFENAALKIGETSYLTNKFNYSKSNNGGYVNKAIYILHYTPELKIEEAKLFTNQEIID
jgi:LysM repeat protein